MPFIIISISPLSDGGMAELVDALDSKSCGLRPCQFESDYPYQLQKALRFKSLFFLSDFEVIYKNKAPF